MVELTEARLVNVIATWYEPPAQLAGTGNETIESVGVQGVHVLFWKPCAMASSEKTKL